MQTNLKLWSVDTKVGVSTGTMRFRSSQQNLFDDSDARKVCCWDQGHSAECPSTFESLVVQQLKTLLSEEVFTILSTSGRERVIQRTAQPWPLQGICWLRFAVGNIFAWAPLCYDETANGVSDAALLGITKFSDEHENDVIHKWWPQRSQEISAQQVSTKRIFGTTC